MSVYESSITNPKKQLEFYKDLSEQLQQENEQLKQANVKLISENNKLQHRCYSSIEYIDQVLMYKPCAREIDKELDNLIGILRGGNND